MTVLLLDVLQVSYQAFFMDRSSGDLLTYTAIINCIPRCRAFQHNGQAQELHCDELKMCSACSCLSSTSKMTSHGRSRSQTGTGTVS